MCCSTAPMHGNKNGLVLDRSTQPGCATMLIICINDSLPVINLKLLFTTVCKPMEAIHADCMLA